MKKYIKQLKSGTAAGVDGITTEHLKTALDSKLPLLLSNMFTICLRYGVLPDSFFKGTLVPILKKVNLDPVIPQNYRPVTVSVVTSTLLEYHMLEQWSGHKFHPGQFGFIEHRGTSTATSLANDVAAYCNAMGSSVFCCSLDVEGAYDALPHTVIMQKAMDVIPNMHWRILYIWYKKMSVNIKWNKSISGNIISVGIRQGGLTSTFLFNLFFQDLVCGLNKAKCGVIIGGQQYNVYCYADDVLLYSTTSSGLQCLINIAVKYISSHGLHFNIGKTECMVRGGNPFTNMPKWSIDGVPLCDSDKIKYLGTILSTRNESHITSRIQAANRAFYALQAAGLKNNYTLSPETAVNIYCTAVRSVLIYGCSSFHLSKSQVQILDRTQGKHLKCMLGIDYSTHTTPILSALSIPSISRLIQVTAVGLLRSIMDSDSMARRFYLHLWKERNNAKVDKTLIGRVQTILEQNKFNVFNSCFTDKWSSIKKDLYGFIPTNSDGMIDTIRMLLSHYNKKNSIFLNRLLKSY